MSKQPERFKRSRAARARREAQARRDNVFIYMLIGASVLVVAALAFLGSVQFGT